MESLDGLDDTLQIILKHQLKLVEHFNANGNDSEETAGMEQVGAAGCWVCRMRVVLPRGCVCVWGYVGGAVFAARSLLTLLLPVRACPPGLRTAPEACGGWGDAAAGCPVLV